MPHFPVLRWGEPYESLDVQPVVHFATGEALGEVSQANAGLLARDMRDTHRAREALREIATDELFERLTLAADLFLHDRLTIGGDPQTVDRFVRCQSATTGLPEHMCRANMDKLHHVLSNLRNILDALTRRLDPEVLSSGFAWENHVLRSRQATTPALGVVLPSNSPGTHGLWLPVPALQIGLVLKPGPQEPWTPYRMIEAFAQAGLPRESFALYPGGVETGRAVVERVPRKIMFGSLDTVEQYRGDPTVQVHGPGFSKILLGDDEADNWRDHIDLLADSVLTNAGRSCINCSSIWTPRHGREIAEALAERLGPIQPLPPEDPAAALAAFTIPEQALGIDAIIERGLRETGAEDATTAHRDGDRLIRHERCAYLRPTIIHCRSPGLALANTEFMFPYASVVECPQDEMLHHIGRTLVATVVSNDEPFRQRALESPDIDRLNLGPIPTFKIDWLQPHEGNLIDFLFRSRAYQTTREMAAMA